MPDAAVCKYFSYWVSASCQVINYANKSDIQVNVLMTEEWAHPILLCMYDEPFISLKESLSHTWAQGGARAETSY